MSNRPPYPGAPRWVKAFAVATVVVVVLVVIALLSGHGPGRHAPSGGGGHAPSSGITEARAPAGGVLR